MNWGLLVRISDDRAGEGAGVARQEEDGRAEVERRGGNVAELYRENDTSAFKRRETTDHEGDPIWRVIRPELRRALRDLRAGHIDALMVYDLDRLARDPRDLEDVIDVAERLGKPVASVTGSLDLTSDHGIFMARSLVAHANASSRDTSRRTRRVHEQLALEGKPSGGRRPYGYERDRKTVIPAEAAVIREIADRRLAGHGWSSIMNDLNDRRVPAAGGGRWTHSSIRGAVHKPHVAGLRRWRGTEGTEVRGVWPAILDEATWRQLQEMKQDPVPPTRRFLLSGLARCGLCGHGLGGRSFKRQTLIYRCTNPKCMKISRRAEPLEEFIVAATLEALARIDLTPSEPPADPALAEQLEALRTRRLRVVAAFADEDDDDPVVLRRTLKTIDDKISRLEARASRGRRQQQLHGLKGITRDQWDALPLDVRRSVIGALFTIVVGRSRLGRVAFDADSIRLDRKW